MWFSLSYLSLPTFVFCGCILWLLCLMCFSSLNVFVFLLQFVFKVCWFQLNFLILSNFIFKQKCSFSLFLKIQHLQRTIPIVSFPVSLCIYSYIFHLYFPHVLILLYLSSCPPKEFYTNWIVIITFNEAICWRITWGGIETVNWASQHLLGIAVASILNKSIFLCPGGNFLVLVIVVNVRGLLKTAF